MRYLEWLLIGLFGSLLFLLMIVLMVLIMPVGCSTSTLKPVKGETSLPNLTASCRKMDYDSVAWALNNKYKVRSQDIMIRKIEGQKIRHFRRVIFNSQIVIYVHYINVKDVEKLKEYASLFKFIDNCEYRSFGQYQIFMEYKQNRRKPKRRLI